MSLCAIFLTFPVQAKELKVKEFKYEKMDLTASTKLRTDNNGNPCALIKVSLPIEDCDFEGNVVGSITYKTNEYYVYITSGTKKLLIKAPDNDPLMVVFNDYQIPAAEGKCTYHLKLDGEFGVTSSTQMQKLSIKYMPKDGLIYINGAQISSAKDDGNISIILPVGTYRYLFICDGKTSVEGIVRLFASSAKEIILTSAGEEMNSASDNNITNEQTLYESAIDAIRKGDDKKAEALAEQGIKQGFEIFNEIYAALYFSGYYDESPLNVKGEILSKIERYDSSRANLQHYRTKYQKKRDNFMKNIND